VETIKGLGSVTDMLKRFDVARKRWNLWRSLHQEAYDFAAPERETFRFRSPGQRKPPSAVPGFGGWNEWSRKAEAGWFAGFGWCERLH
jgi:hypothetical protein